MIKILIVDDERTARKGLFFMLQSEAYQLEEAESEAQAEELLKNQEFDLAIVDLRLPAEKQGLSLIKSIRVMHPMTPVLIMTAFGSIESAVKAIKSGAQDYVTKDFTKEEIILKVKNLLENRRLRLNNLRLSEQVTNLKGNLELLGYKDRIVGESQVIKQILDLTVRVGKDNESTALITGESGTGKELIARLIHSNSTTRTEQKFIVIDLANMPTSLLESQLFGHEKGSFTNAHQQHIGLFEMANKGTVFLDEIGDFPSELQVKLLRFLQEKNFYRVGGTKPIHSDVRIIAATNKNPEELMRNNKLRDDLYYRINVVRIHLPALRDRKDDIPMLVKYFQQKLEIQKGRNLIIQEAILKKIIDYHWPGNIRQLKNFIERLYITCPTQQVSENDLNFTGLPEQHIKKDLFTSLLKLPFREAKKQLVESFEKHFLKYYMQIYNSNISKIASVVGESREGLSKKIKRYGLKNNL